MKYLVIVWALLPFLVQAQSPDTLKVMTYNLLYYGVNTSFCTTANNNVQTKNGHFQTILQHTQPHVLGVQEMGGVSHSVGFLQQVLNTNGETRWTRAPYINTNGSNLVSLLYYRTDKLTYASHEAITTQGRDIAFYTLYYNVIPFDNDTIFIHFAVMHLKAGGSTADANQRGAEAQAMMNWLNQRNFRGNLVIMGDFNVNSSSEPAYVQFTGNSNENIRLYDPVNQPGNWANNSAFAALHTQAPTINGNGCTSGGGMDDRYDQLMINRHIKDDSARVFYIPGSYTTVGNDGIRFNGAVNTPSNQQVPPAVANALAAASDHLPVSLQLHIRPGFGTSVAEELHSKLALRFNSLVQDDLWIWTENEPQHAIKIALYDLQGRQIMQTSLDKNNAFQLHWPAQHLQPGIYLLRWENGQKQAGAARLLKY